MFHFFKKNKVVVDCFTNIPAVYDNCKINYGAHYFPDWWKETPKYIDNNNTIKSCRGFIDYYKTGLVIPSWFEADIHVFGKNDPEHRQFSIKYSNNYVDVSKSHDSIQFLNFAKDTGRNIKIKSSVEKILEYSASETKCVFNSTSFSVNGCSITNGVNGGIVIVTGSLPTSMKKFIWL